MTFSVSESETVPTGAPGTGVNVASPSNWRTSFGPRTHTSTLVAETEPSGFPVGVGGLVRYALMAPVRAPVVGPSTRPKGSLGEGISVHSPLPRTFLHSFRPAVIAGDADAPSARTSAVVPIAFFTFIVLRFP